MTGTVVQVNVSRGGVPKRAIPVAELTANGIDGDAWRYPFHGGRQKAILLITIEGIEELVSRGFPLFAGALGENITTRGVALLDLPVGTVLGWVRRPQCASPACATLVARSTTTSAACWHGW